MGVQRWAFQLTVPSSHCYTLLSEEAAVPLEEEEKLGQKISNVRGKIRGGRVQDAKY